MAFFYNTTTKEYPKYIGDLQIDHPEWDGQIDTAPTPWVWVEDVTPEYIEDKVIEDAEPQQVNGVWTRQFTHRDLTADEQARIAAPASAKAKLIALGFTENEINALVAGLLR